MLAAEAGAAMVIGVDHSAIADTAKEVVKDNRLEGVVTILRGRVQEVELPEGIAEVDIILSEWMGLSLLYKNSLTAVLFARDKWLAPNGLVFPDRCRLFLAGVETLRWGERRFGFWEHVHGFRMDSIARASRREVEVVALGAGPVVTTPCLVKELDLMTCGKADLGVSSDFYMKVTRKDYVTALIAYFDVTFTHGRERVVLATGPEDPATHWKQVLFHLQEAFTAEEGDTIEGTIVMKEASGGHGDVEAQVEVRMYDVEDNLRRSEETSYVLG